MTFPKLTPEMIRQLVDEHIARDPLLQLFGRDNIFTRQMHRGARMPCRGPVRLHDLSFEWVEGGHARPPLTIKFSRWSRRPL